MAAHSSSLLLTPEEREILTRAQAPFTGNIEKCFNVSFSTAERERYQHHVAASPTFSPSDPSLIAASDFNTKESELNVTKGRLDALDLSVWSQAVNRYKLTGSINSDVRRSATLIRLTPSLLSLAQTLSRHFVQVLQSRNVDHSVAQDVRDAELHSRQRLLARWRSSPQRARVRGARRLYLRHQPFFTDQAEECGVGLDCTVPESVVRDPSPNKQTTPLLCIERRSCAGTRAATKWWTAIRSS